MTGQSDGMIVVGVDGSPNSRAAVAWAREEARLRGATLHAVHAWQFPAISLTSFGTATLPVLAPEDLAAAADKVMTEMLGDLTADPSVKVTTSVERGHPAEVLVAAAKGAEMLVVGSRGHGGFAGMLLGSVSSQVVHHAPCPVVVVRGQGVEDDAG